MNLQVLTSTFVFSAIVTNPSTIPLSVSLIEDGSIICSLSGDGGSSLLDDAVTAEARGLDERARLGDASERVIPLLLSVSISVLVHRCFNFAGGKLSFTEDFFLMDNGSMPNVVGDGFLGVTDSASPLSLRDGGLSKGTGAVAALTNGNGEGSGRLVVDRRVGVSSSGLRGVLSKSKLISGMTPIVGLFGGRGETGRGPRGRRSGSPWRELERERRSLDVLEAADSFD